MLDPKIIKEILETFKVEFNELQTSILENLYKMKKSLDDKDALEEIFRAAHTIKGSSNSLSLNKIGDIAEELETRFAKWRHNEEKPTLESIDECIEKTKSMSKHLEAEE